MSKKEKTTEIIEGLLRFTLFTGTLTIGMFAPGAVQAFEKPLDKYFKHLDEKQRKRELRKTIRYMRRTGLIRGDYEHGLQITEKGKDRLRKAEINNLKIERPKKWDKKWRIVLFDVPEKYKPGRDSLTRKLKDLGFYQLQKSVWIFPFVCRGEIEKVAAVYDVDRFVTYIETSYIDKQESLKKKFKI